MPSAWRGSLTDWFCLIDEDVWSSRLDLLSACAAETFTGKFDAISVVDEAIQDGVDVGGPRSHSRGTSRHLAEMPTKCGF
jgi:hypothetical protein